MLPAMEKTFRDKVLAAIKARGLTMAEAARDAKVSYNVIRELYRRNGTVKAENAMKLAAEFGIDLPDRPADAEALPAVWADLVPVYNVQAGAGSGVEVLDPEEIVERLAFPPGYLRGITKSNPKNLAIISVKGESMSPTLNDNDVVMIDRSKVDLSYEGLFVLRDGGSALLVKRITRGTRADTVLIISDNKAYPTVEREKRHIDVIGKVVWMGVKA